MRVLIFTHPPDYAAAAIASRAWKALGVSPVWALEPKHEAPTGQEHLFTKAPRGGNLNGLPFCLELLELMQHFDFKADSDTMPFSLEWANVDAPLVGFTRSDEKRDMFGCAWRMRREDSKAFLKLLQDEPEICEQSQFAEDLTVGALGKRIGRHLHKYNPNGCPLAGWNWKTVLTEAVYRKLFQVINVQRPWGIPTAEARAMVVDKMERLMAAA